MRAFTTGALFAVAFALSGCLTPFHVTVGDIDATQPDLMKRFEVELRVGGLDEGVFLEYMSQSLDSILYMFSQGPRTGRPIRKAGMGGSLIEDLHKKCPSGKITGLLTVRESKNFYFYQQEIVRISGYCILEE